MELAKNKACICEGAAENGMSEKELLKTLFDFADSVLEECRQENVNNITGKGNGQSIYSSNM